MPPIRGSFVRPAPKKEDIDPNEKPVVKSANGVILKTGRFSCNECRREMKNSSGCIRTHFCKFHRKGPNGEAIESAYQRGTATRVVPCMYCKKTSNNLYAHYTHMNKNHPEEYKKDKATRKALSELENVPSTTG